MYRHIYRDRKFESVCFCASAVVLVLSFSTLWFLFVVCALLYTFGLLPSPSSITSTVGSAVAIGVVVGVLGAASVVSLLFVVFFLCRNIRNRKTQKGQQVQLAADG